MTRILSISVENQFADVLGELMAEAGYTNRSMFLRDAALHFSEFKRRGDLHSMADDELVEGHLVVYYQHGVEHKLLDIRHSHDLDISSYNHSCLTHSHTCVDVLHAVGMAHNFRKATELLQNTPNIDKVTFIAAPMRDEGCC
jgi:metal-responsive CopG/Arc/MetJ family transcriptional regulator